jgi:hypothetical protein
MKKICFFTALALAILSGTQKADAQALKIDLPYLLVGAPNIGAEFTLSQQLTINGDILWMPFMYKTKEEVFRVLQTSLDLRCYVNPKYYYTNDMFDGFYVGPYAMYGRFNIGFATHANPDDNRRFRGWGMSAGVSLGYKFYLSRRLRLDLNMGIGYMHLQFDRFILGGEWAEYPIARKDTEYWIGPTKFGVHLVYNLFR